MKCTSDCPGACRDVLNVVATEEATLVDAVLTGDLEHDDIKTFLTDAADCDVDPGLIHFVEVVETLLEEHTG